MSKNHFNWKHGLIKHPIYSSWGMMKTRCLNKNRRDYKWYGGKGVKIYEPWINDFKAFYDWAINNGWKPGLELDKDIKGDGMFYGPETCSWVTPFVNKDNRRNIEYFEYNGEKLTLNDITDKLKIPKGTIRSRIRLGWSMNEIFTVPKNQKIRCFRR